MNTRSITFKRFVESDKISIQGTFILTDENGEQYLPHVLDGKGVVIVKNGVHTGRIAFTRKPVKPTKVFGEQKRLSDCRKKRNRLKNKAAKRAARRT